jgi:hypothetical protein
MNTEFTFKQAIKLPDIVNVTNIVVCKYEIIHMTFVNEPSSDYSAEFLIEYWMGLDDYARPIFCVDFEGTRVLTHILMDVEDTTLAKNFFETAKMLEADNLNMTMIKNINMLIELYDEAERNVDGIF